MRMIRSFGLAPDSSHQFGRQLPTPDNIRILDERVSPNHIILDMCSETLLTTFGISIRRGLGQMFACPRTNEAWAILSLPSRAPRAREVCGGAANATISAAAITGTFLPMCPKAGASRCHASTMQATACVPAEAPTSTL